MLINVCLFLIAEETVQECGSIMQSDVVALCAIIDWLAEVAGWLRGLCLFQSKW